MRNVIKWVVVLVGMLVPLASLFAQETDITCETLISDLADQVEQSCAGLASGQGCYGNGTATLMAEEELQFEGDGDLVDLAAVQGFQTSTTEDSLGVVMLAVPTDTPDQFIRLALFGDAALENKVGAAVEVVELPVSNRVGYAVNLREGAGTSFGVAGIFDYNMEGIANGRSADNRWIRVTLDDLTAWVSAELVKVDGDVNTLAVMDNPFIHPMQAFTLTTESSETPCGAGASGLLVQYSGEAKAALQVNGAEVTFGKGTLLLQAQAEGELMLYVLDNDIEVSSGGERIAVASGESAQITLGGEDGLTAASAPTLNRTYSFAAVQNLPTGLLSQDNFVCLAGVSEPQLASLTEPKADSPVFTDLDPDSHYQVIGWVEDEAGVVWWQLGDGSWLPAASAQTTNACAQVGQVEPVAASRSNAGTAPVSTGDVSSLFEGRTIWQADSGAEVSTGTCNFPPLAMCQHLVAITPNADGTISWRGQELEPYTLFPGGGNFFSFSGRNKLNNANITLALTFNSTDYWTMTMTQVFDNDPQCIRTFNYTATRNH